MNQIIYQLADLDDIHDLFNHQVAIKSYDPGVALNTCSIYFFKGLSFVSISKDATAH